MSTAYFRVVWTVLAIVLMATDSLSATEEHGGADGETESAHDEELVEAFEEPAYAVLYPSLILTFGVLVFYLLSRYLHFLPYTAIMFLLGTFMGIGAAASSKENHIHQTILAWQSINSEVLLLVFLPGLIFKDALGQNVHLFTIALGQLFIFAFPLVLAGTVLTALIGYYIFPYGWSFNLAMTFGSILSATDPVAVAALLEEVGAPPRLKTHIAGESLLNDGAAIVFFSIFSEKFFYELGIEHFGEDIDWAAGVSLFCQKALGGCAFGILFGIGILLVLYFLDRRFSKEENVVQVTAVVALAYLNYYVADFVAKTSGVIATVVAGLLLKFLGRSSVNDIHLMDDFFVLTEHILNTILFSLGGLVWGGVVVENHRDGIWRGRDWGYLIMLYILLHVIRTLLFVSTYPITARIGLHTNWPETIFQIYGGLRGAVGIALAIALDNEVYEVTEGDDTTKYERWTTEVYEMVGGIALLTLIINGTTAGPMLKWLGLVDSSETREKMIEAYKIHFRSEQIDAFVELLSYTRFRNVDFGLVKFHVPYLADLTLLQLTEAVEKLKDSTPPDKYRPPQIDRVVPYLVDKNDPAAEEIQERLNKAVFKETKDQVARSRKIEERKKKRALRRERRNSSTLKFMMTGEPFSTKEMRLLFISMVRAAYEHQINEGELESQHILAVALEQSLEQAEADVQGGKPLDDFQYLQRLHHSGKQLTGWIKSHTRAFCCRAKWGKLNRVNYLNQKLENAYVEQAMAFTSAHKRAQFLFQEQLGGLHSDLSEAGKVVMAESQAQVDMALKDLDEKVNKQVVRLAVSHKFCKILLNKGIQYIERLVGHGLLKESEAEEIVEELEHLLEHVISCNESSHEGEMDISIVEVGGDGEDHDLRASTLHINAEDGHQAEDTIQESPAEVASSEPIHLDTVPES